jgi:hypothetical protein
MSDERRLSAEECKQVRNDRGYWEAVEVYLANHSTVDVSHGVCPACEARRAGDVG